jgi:hypothetical protein
MLWLIRSAFVGPRSSLGLENAAFHQRHTCCQRQFPNVSHTRAGWQELVPSGGRAGAVIGGIAGATIGQIWGGQIGGRSIELSHSGCMWPFTHSQVHSASAVDADDIISTTTPKVFQGIIGRCLVTRRLRSASQCPCPTQPRLAALRSAVCRQPSSGDTAGNRLTRSAEAYQQVSSGKPRRPALPCGPRGHLCLPCSLQGDTLPGGAGRTEWPSLRCPPSLFAVQCNRQRRQKTTQFCSGADGGTRTHTEFPPRDFKSLASTISPRPLW